MTTVAPIPALEELQRLPQWVMWRKEVRGGKSTKVPYNAYTGKRAESNNPATWASYSRVQETLQKYPTLYDGIGFMFNRTHTGIDLDHCVHEDGSIDPWAQEIIASLQSYAEYSPSRTGIHVIVRGCLPQMTDKHGEVRHPGTKRPITHGTHHPAAAIEMYCEGRFFTVTGQHIEDTPLVIEDREVQLLSLHAEITTPISRSTTSPKQQKRQPPAAARGPFDLSDNELIDLASSAQNGAKFQALYRGDTSGYVSQSEADQALCNMLAFWTGRDASRMDTLFRRSALYREDKWDRNARRGETYGEGTIARAIEQCSEVYTPQSKKPTIYVGSPTRSTAHTAPSEPPEVLPSPNGSGNLLPLIFSTSDSAEQPLPEIVIGRQLRDIVRDALAALRTAEAEHPTIFIQSARLVQIGRDEKQRPLIMQIGIPELKNALSRAANFFRLRETSKAYVASPVSPPKELAEAILALDPSTWPFPPLDAIVETPVMRPDGTILDVPGYDTATRLYYLPRAGMDSCAVPLTPTQDDIKAALDIIWDVIGEFPYVEQADRANALALLLTPIVRPAIKRHIPLGLIDAPKQGTGKGLLADVVAITATGETASILTAPDNEEEWDKRITAKLIQGNTIITIDNIAGRLQSAKLDAVLTATIYEGRLLGQSKMIQVPNLATWLATGNNIKLGGDLARRCFRIRLDPHVSRPWMRTGFKHEDLATYVTEHRADVIGALLTLARAWYVAGHPCAAGIPSLGTFTGWAKTIGSILTYVGVPGFLSNLEKLYAEADEESAQWEAFLQAWYETFGNESVTTSQLIARITDSAAAGSGETVAGSPLSETLPEALQFALKDKPMSFSIKLGKALEKRVDTCFGEKNLHIERGEDGHKKQKVWRVVAGSAGSVPSHMQKTSSSDEKNTTTKNPKEEEEKDRGNYEGDNSTHSPQEQKTAPSLPVSQNSSRSGLSAMPESANDGASSEQVAALPVTLSISSSASNTPTEKCLRELYMSVKQQLPQLAPHGTLLWRVSGSGFDQGMVDHSEYCRRLLALCKSGIASLMSVAQEEMRGILNGRVRRDRA